MDGARIVRSGALAVAMALTGSLPAAAADLVKVRFGTNWLAEAEHGGFYQAVADGTYAKHGLEVEIVQGGPQTNNLLLLPTGKIDFYMGGNMIQAFASVAEGVPIITVASLFQKEPQILMTHPGQGLDTWESLKGSSNILVGSEFLATNYKWMISAFGFREDQTKPYNFSPAPFLVDPKAVQEGYITSEPLSVEKEGGFKPNVFLLADYGFDTYSTTIETRQDMVRDHPDVVQRFVDASIIGWMTYLYGDNHAGNEAIKRDNPDMSDEQIAYSVAKMKEHGIVDSGDALTLGVGAMTDARMASFFGKMVKAGMFKADLDYRKSYTLAFVNKRVGAELRR